MKVDTVCQHKSSDSGVRKSRLKYLGFTTFWLCAHGQVLTSLYLSIFVCNGVNPQGYCEV